MNSEQRLTCSTAWVDISSEPPVLILRVSGELDLASRDAIEAAVMVALTSTAEAVVDLTDLTFCDSTGLAMFIAAQQKADSNATTLVFRGLRNNVRRLFAISGIDTVLCVIE